VKFFIGFEFFGGESCLICPFSIKLFAYLNKKLSSSLKSRKNWDYDTLTIIVV